MLLRAALLIAGLLLGLWARAVAVDSGGVSFAARTAWGWVYLLFVGWAAMAAAVVVLPQRRRSGLLLYATGCWWFLIELAEPSVGLPIAFTLGLGLSAAGPALVAHLALSFPTGRLQGSWPDKVIVAAGYAVLVGWIGVVQTALFNPDPLGCVGCPRNLLSLGRNDPAVFDAVDFAGTRMGAAWLLCALGVVVWRVLSAGQETRQSVGPVVAPATVFLGASLAQYLNDLAVGASASGGSSAIYWQLEGACLLTIAAGASVELWRTRRARRSLTRLVIELTGASAGGLRVALANRLNDPNLLIGYPIDNGRRHVDADAQPVDLTPTKGRRITPLLRDGVELATLAHRPETLTQHHQVDDLITSIRLALENERLAAQDRVQLAQIRSSGARIVAAGDAERRRIERDLHDGAQQRLVALLLALRLIDTDIADPTLAAAVAELRCALADLRALAHGIYPILLRDAGLKAALNALAESRHLQVEIEPDHRYPDVIETTVYLFVSQVSAGGRATVQIRQAGNHLRVIAITAAPQNLGADLHDRITTLNGRLEVTTNQASALVTLTLPIENSTACNQE